MVKKRFVVTVYNGVIECARMIEVSLRIDNKGDDLLDVFRNY